MALLDQLRDIDLKTQEIYGSYVQLSEDDKDMAAQQMEAYKEELDNLQSEFVQQIAPGQEELAEEDEHYITQLFLEIGKRFNAFYQLAVPEVFRQSAPLNAKSVIPPRVSATSADELDQNVKDLREQLQAIHQAIIEAETANEITQDELQESKTIKDISTMAVTQLRTSTIQQNALLKKELESVRNYLADTLAENNELRAQQADYTLQIQALEHQCQLGLYNTNQLFAERERNKQDFDRLSGDLERAKSKFSNLKELYDFEVDNYAQFREDAYKKISNLEAERSALQEVNYRLSERIQEVERCDTDSASIEIKKAAETIKQLTTTVAMLKYKLTESRTMKNDDQDRLKATIAVISDGYLDKALDQDAIDKSKLIQELNESRSELEQYKELISSVTKKDGVSQLVMSNKK